ncbi:hypothetical protein LCGC14_3034160 [marine sediment metagenome]|uniref:Uncharacterized protein n=1 Tax=marine sediment metagenome TaxID=412755 RepID=A0A0F8WS31_9ZZZZ
MRKQRIITLTLTFFGILIGLGSLLGFFKYDEREDFYLYILDQKSDGINISHPALNDFKHDFPAPENFHEYKVIKGVTHAYDEKSIAGNIIYENTEDGKEIHAATYEQVRRWSEESISGWLSLLCILFGFTWEVIILIREKMLVQINKDSINAVPD